MNNTLWVAILFCMSPSFASEPAPQRRWIFTIDGKKQVFVHLPDQNYTLSEKCFSKKGNVDCEAFRALSKATLRGLDPELLERGTNPGSPICRKKLGGSVVIGSNEAGAENSFCLFSDGSMIDSGSLSAAAQGK